MSLHVTLASVADCRIIKEDLCETEKCSSSTQRGRLNDLQFNKTNSCIRCILISSAETDGWLQIYTTEQKCTEASPLAPYLHQHSLSDQNSFRSPLYVKVYVCAKEKKSVHLCNTCILPHAFFL